MNHSNSSSSRFQALLQAFTESTGLPSDDADQALGIEFAAGDFVARVLQHPQHDELVQIEVEVRQLDVDSAAASSLLLLHRLNNTARFEHNWLIAIDDDDSLVIATSQPISNTDAAALQALIADGIDRAEALDGLWLAAAEGGSLGASASAARHTAMPSGAIRA